MDSVFAVDFEFFTVEQFYSQLLCFVCWHNFVISALTEITEKLNHYSTLQ